MVAKILSGLLAFIRNPLEVYRLGWFVMAGAASFYLFVIIVKAGFGTNGPQVASRISPERESHRPVAQASRYEDNAFQNWTGSAGMTGQQGQYASSNSFSHHMGTDGAGVYQANVIKPKLSGHAEQQQFSFQQDLKNASVRTEPSAKKKHTRKQNTKKKQHRRATNKKTGKKSTATKNSPFFSDKYVHDVGRQDRSSGPRIEMVKTRKPRAEIFGVKLAKGKTIDEVRTKWRKLYARHHKKMRNLGPLIIKEKSGDGYPIQLIIGPFTSPNRAVRFCAALSRHLNCNLKRYNGTPL